MKSTADVYRLHSPKWGCLRRRVLGGQDDPARLEILTEIGIGLF